ncbi:hypothetical protein GNF98_13035 [Clostridium perfringens]|uniref:WbqC family protein n=1 Tax=Clostridium perfringens TaxID=1502 RepID=UPI002A2A4F3F|nr:WbqC family protein [Clostridium perfringens]
MKVGIMQPYFLPYIGYWQLLNAVDVYVIYDDVNFIKGGWINRNRLLMNNEPKLFNIKMNGASPNKLINEIELCSNLMWKKKLLKTISSCYKKAKYYDDVFPMIEKIINYDEKNMALYIKNSFEVICDYIGINTNLVLSSTIEKNNELRAEDKVIEICKILGGTEYYNAIGGQDLYLFENFRNSGLKLSFLKTNSIEYKQFNNEFVSNLSILDVLMFNCKDKIKKFLDEYTLVT